jgi:hypothetical protein
MENKQTAVQWLVEKIQQANPSFKFDALIRQAKQMEKEQIIKAFNEGTFSEMEKINAEQYYNENYKSE